MQGNMMRVCKLIFSYINWNTESEAIAISPMLFYADQTSTISSQIKFYKYHDRKIVTIM